MKPVTILDVARAADVHAATVSRALRGLPGLVAEQTRLRVEEAARALGYRHNALASALRTGTRDLIGIVVPDLANPFYGPMVRSLEQALRADGWMCLVAQEPRERAERRDVVRALAQRQVAGLVICAVEARDPMLDEARRAALPVVLVNASPHEMRHSVVRGDHARGVHLVVEHLWSLGHRRIVHLAGPADSTTARQRARAFGGAMRACGRGGTGVIVDSAGYTRQAGYDATTALLDRGSRLPTALFAANDLVAVGALDALRQRGVQVPRDVSLVGYNDLPLVDLIDPPLTTVRLPVDEMMRRAAALVRAHVDAPARAPQRLVSKPELVVRASTAAAPKR